jgi:putative hydrolase of the HAD superfamily
MVKAVFFDLDDTLYNTTQQVESARDNAVKAMISAGLETSVEEAKMALKKVVEDKGPNHQHHYDDMLRALGLKADPKVVAAGVVAYHDTKSAYMVPYSDTVKTLLELWNGGYLMGIVTDGVPVKQWEKLIRLGLKDFFHTVVITSDSKKQKPSPHSFRKAASSLKVQAGECMMVGDRLDRDILGGNRAGMTTVQLSSRKTSESPSSEDEKPALIISRLNDLLKIIGSVE